VKTTKSRGIGMLVLIYALLAGFQTVRPQSPRLRPRLMNPDITVTLNPYGLTPLAAVADFTTTLKCSVQVRVLGDVEVIKTFEDFKMIHSIPILGLYPDRLNIVVLTLTPHHGLPEIRTLFISTDPLPDFFPEVKVHTAIPDRMEPGMNLCVFSLGDGNNRLSYPMIFDKNGDVRWYMDLSSYNGWCVPFERIKNGNFVFGLGDSMYEYDMLGKLINHISVPRYNFHHDIIELPNGNFIAAADQPGTTIINSHGELPSWGDHMIEIDRSSGAVITEWDMRQLLDVARNEQMASNGDWFHMNSFWYSEKDDCFIISGRHQGLVKVTRDNRLKWILAGHLGWGNSGYDGSGFDTTPFLLTAVDVNGNPYNSQIQDGLVAGDDFDWTWGAHFPLILPDGNIFIFDNGARRNFSPGGPFYSRGVEYRVNENDMTVQQVWEYGKERGQETFSIVISNVDYLPLTQNRLIVPGIVEIPPEFYAKIIEVSYPDKLVVFEATVYFKNLIAVGSDNGPYDTIYRSHCLSIYP
jgi:arylsulfate sulfotransferase